MFQNFFHSWRSAWLEYFYEDDLKQSLVQLAPVEEGDFVLDLGCGSGQATCWIKERFAVIKVIGLDSSSAKIKRARQRAKQRELSISFISFSGYAFPFRNAQFDKVLICFLEKPLPNTEYQNALEEIYRVLHAQGEMLFAE